MSTEWKAAPLWRRIGRRTLALVTGAAVVAGLLSGCSDKAETLAEPEPVGGPALVRRLTESQYRATIADIFGPEVPVTARFGRPLRSEGLIAVGTSEAGISPFSVEQYNTAAIGVADAVLGEKRRDEFVPCQPVSEKSFDEACARAFVAEYGRQLFRRPLTEDQAGRFVDAARRGSDKLGGFYDGLKFALVGMMTSPQFLLRIEETEPDSSNPGLRELDDFSKAARLSFFLTNSTPDRELLRAAAEGELDTEQGLARQVDRLIASPRFEEAVRAYFRDMLEFELFDDLAKDSQIYPAFNSRVAADAREQTLRTITHHLVDNNGDYRDLFTLRETFLTRALGIVYRQPVPTRNGWEKTAFPADGPRAGIQSHISFLALHSHPGRSSPTLRGKAIREVFLCQEVPEPPADIDFSVVQDPSPEKMPTARDRLQAHNTEPACAGCHKIMDPPGLALENFDGLGTFRKREYEAVIDASGSLDGNAFQGPAGFAQALRNHRETPRCLAEKMYRFAVGRDTVWKERSYMDYLIRSFAADDYQVPQLMRTIALSDNFFAINPSANIDAGHQQAKLGQDQEDRS